MKRKMVEIKIYGKNLRNPKNKYSFNVLTSIQQISKEALSKIIDKKLVEKIELIKIYLK